MGEGFGNALASSLTGRIQSSPFVSALNSVGQQGFGQTIQNMLVPPAAAQPNPVTQGSAATPASKGVGATQLPPANITAQQGSVPADYIYNGLVKRGLNPAQAYATLGNWKQESELKPTAYNPGEGAIGFDQWRLDRAQALKQFAAQQGKSPFDPDTQMDFYMNELKSGRPGSRDFLSATDIPSANRALKTFIAYGSPYDKGGEGTRLANSLAYARQGLGGVGSLPASERPNVSAGIPTPKQFPAFSPEVASATPANLALPDQTPAGVTQQMARGASRLGDMNPGLPQDQPAERHNLLAMEAASMPAQKVAQALAQAGMSKFFKDLGPQATIPTILRVAQGLGGPRVDGLS